MTHRDRKPLSVSLARDSLRVGDSFAVSLQRTLRIPDDGREYPLPPGLGRFPIRRAPGAEARFLVPIHQCEALWLSFEGGAWPPHAVKVGIGGIDALTGAPFDPGVLSMTPQDHLVAPEQPWLDGINAGDGHICQFVAVPLGSGHTVEAQLTGTERRGGLQLLVVPPNPGAFAGPPPPLVCACADGGAPMGLAAGGRMRQQIAIDGHGTGAWDMSRATLVDLRLCNSADWRAITGEEPPPTPISVETYNAHGLPWFELYSERGDVAPSAALPGVHSLSELPESTEHLPYNAPVRATFDRVDQVFGGEGFVVYAAERDGVPYIVNDAGTMADFIVDEDADLLDTMITVHRFGSFAARERWVRAERRRFHSHAAAQFLVRQIDAWLARSGA
jgi:hypothetical protein